MVPERLLRFPRSGCPVPSEIGSCEQRHRRDVRGLRVHRQCQHQLCSAVVDDQGALDKAGGTGSLHRMVLREVVRRQLRPPGRTRLREQLDHDRQRRRPDRFVLQRVIREDRRLGNQGCLLRQNVRGIRVRQHPRDVYRLLLERRSALRGGCF